MGGRGNSASRNSGSAGSTSIQSQSTKQPEVKSIPKSRVEVNTDRYTAFNGRPSGYGTWAFYMGKETADSRPVFFTGSYTEAKKKAIEYAAERGIDRIIVGT